MVEYSRVLQDSFLGSGYKPTGYLIRHGILHNSSASKNPQFTSFHKISPISILFSSIFHVIIAINMMQMPNKALNSAFCVENLQDIGFHTLI
jgi:hypothetical protein